jgi:hypothetical protein
MRLFLAFLTVLILGSAARADEASRPCDRSNASCRWLATGSPDADYLAESALEVFRFHLGGFQTPDRVYMVTRSLDGSVLIDMRPVQASRGEITSVAGAQVWSHLMDRWKRFERDEDAFIAAAAKEKPVDTIDAQGNKLERAVICADGYAIDFETVLGGKIARRSPETCVHPLVDEISRELPAYLLAQVPYCARIPEKLRDACFGLEGNRFEAADAVAPVFVFVGHNLCKAGNDAALADVFAPDARLTWNAQTWTGKGIAGHVREQLCAKPYRSLSLDLIDGRLDGSVVVSGTISHFEGDTGATSAFFEAPFTQVWRRDGSSPYRIASWDVGSFAHKP